MYFPVHCVSIATIALSERAELRKVKSVGSYGCSRAGSLVDCTSSCGGKIPLFQFSLDLIVTTMPAPQLIRSPSVQAAPEALQKGQPSGGASQASISVSNGKRSRSKTRSRSGQDGSVKGQQLEPTDRRNKVALEQYVNRELLHTAQRIESKKRSEEFIKSKTYNPATDAKDLKNPGPPGEIVYWNRIREARKVNPAEVLGKGYDGYGNGVQEKGFGAHILRPAERRRPGGRQKRTELRVSKKDRKAVAEQIDELVPIRLDIQYEGMRLRDTFTWNMNDRTVSYEQFARTLVEDLTLPAQHSEYMVQAVINAMREQITDYHPHAFINEEPLDQTLPYTAYKDDDMRIIIKINITVGGHTFIDQVEWDINNPLNSPEDFAVQTAKDLSLSGEFTTAIAHQIREQCQLFSKSLYMTGHPFDGRPIEDHELQSAFQPTLQSAFRPFNQAKDFTPILYEINDTELEKNELAQSREERRQKRSVNRRGGPTLPDLKERKPTVRTMVVSSVLPESAASQRESRLFKHTAPPGKTRRGGRAEDSEDSDSDDSLRESSEIGAHLLSGTARTRGMRGAASAAQIAMRNLGRSATPDSIGIHHEARMGRRNVIRDSSSPEPQSLIVKMKLGRSRMQQFLRAQRAKSKDMSQTPQPFGHGSNAVPTPAPMGPPSSTYNGVTPTRPAKASVSGHSASSRAGVVDATGPPGADHPAV